MIISNSVYNLMDHPVFFVKITRVRVLLLLPQSGLPLGLGLCRQPPDVPPVVPALVPHLPRHLADVVVLVLIRYSGVAPLQFVDEGLLRVGA